MSEKYKDKYLDKACSDYTPTFTHDGTSWALASLSSRGKQELKSEGFKSVCDRTKQDRTEPKGSHPPYRQ